jgi:hypothetical protein
MTTNVSYSIHTLSKDEVLNILEALLFASSVDVCADFYKENSLACFELAKKIRKMFPEVILENLYIHVSEDKKNFNDEHSEDIIKYFPEISKDPKI